MLTYTVLHGASRDPLKFLCYLIIALVASRLKVNLPGITGTMSVNFLFLLLGVLELSFSETMALGCAAVVVQCLDRERPAPIQVAFNVFPRRSRDRRYVCCLSDAHVASSRGQSFHAIVSCAACVYFVANTVPVAAVISLTERKSLPGSGRMLLLELPYYLVGAGVAG